MKQILAMALLAAGCGLCVRADEAAALTQSSGPGDSTDSLAELGPTLDVTPHVRGEITGGVGIRYWF